MRGVEDIVDTDVIRLGGRGEGVSCGVSCCGELVGIVAVM